MPVEAGQTLLHYRIVDKIGEGGMGVVWLAQDTSLGREVAIKVLPPAWAGDAERLQRFEREARLLASLNHPNVATVHGLHEAATPAGTVRFIAMERVPGEDLADRIQRGRIDLEQALTIARRIAEGLEAAHAAGVVHRDLKPANIRLTPDGKVKVLDFGLAKGGTSQPSGDPHLSPTLTYADTRAGVIMGTAAYMAPEQAKGHAVDKRADVWAFGVVLYEMLSGTSAFRGDSVADTIASVLKLEVDLDKLPAETPAAVRRVLRRCLQKDPERRLRDIADARIELEEIEIDDAGPTARGVAAPSFRRRTFGWPVLLLAIAAAMIAGGWAWSVLDGRTANVAAIRSEPVRRSFIPIPDGKVLNRGKSVAISPDGTVLAMTAGLDGEARLYVRRLDTDETRAIPGTEGASFPFFSPQGDEIGFFGDAQLKKVSFRGRGEQVTVLCNAPTSGSAAWDTRGRIYFTYGESRLAWVAESGGRPNELGNVGDVHTVSALPGGRGILMTLHGSAAPSTRKETSQVAVLLPDDRTVRTILDGGFSPTYLAGGYLVFVRGGGLFAASFDLESLETTSPAISVQPGLEMDSMWGVARYDTADDGTLLFAPGGDFAYTVPTWIDLATGDQEPLPIPAGYYNTFDLSPDGSRLVIQVLGGAQDQISVFDARQGTFTRLTEQGANTYPAWSHDGREVFFASNRAGEHRLFRAAVDGSSPAVRLLTDEQEALMGTPVRWPKSASPDGRYLVIDTWSHPTQGGDLWLVPLDGSDPRVILDSEVNEIIPQVSPDGKWLAYITNRTGDYRTVIRRFGTEQTEEWVISGPDGYDPRWSPRGDAIYYRVGARDLMRVHVIEDGRVAPGVAEKVLEIEAHDSSGSSLAVSPDGKRILVNKPVEFSLTHQAPLRLVTGWAQEVARVVQAQ